MQRFDLIIRNGNAILPAQGRAGGRHRDARREASPRCSRPAPPPMRPTTLDARGLTVHARRDRRASSSRPRQGHQPPARAGGRRAGDRRGRERRRDGVHPLPDGDRAVRGRSSTTSARVTEAGSRIDFGYHFIISTEEQLAGVPRYATDYGAPSFKIFMNNRGGEGARLGLPDIDDGFLLRLCESGGRERRHGVPASRDDRAGLGAAQARARRPIPNGTRRPRDVEREPPALRRGRCGAARRLHRRIGGLSALRRAHLVGRGARRRAAAARRGPHGASSRPARTTSRTTSSWAGGDIGKINPPLREAVRSRGAVGGHRATAASTRSRPTTCIATSRPRRAASGRPRPAARASRRCCRCMLSEGHHKRGIPLARIVELLATNPARIMGFGRPQGRHRGRARRGPRAGRPERHD